MEMVQDSSFEHLPLAKTEIPPSLVGMYRVYKDAKNFTVIQAGSALQALETSGVGQAFKIERESFYNSNLLSPSFFQNEHTATAPQQESSTEPTPPPVAADTPLSNNDVDKLLGDTK